MLRWRLLLGVVLIAALVGLFWLDFVTEPPGCYLFGLTLLVGLAGAGEVIALLNAAGYAPLPSVVYGGTSLVIASNAIPLFYLPVEDEQPLARLAWPLLALVATVLLALVGELRRYMRPGGVMAGAALSIFGVIYIGLLLSFALQLRVLGGPGCGMVALVALIVVVKMGDIGAYTIGRLFGRHKMSPVISPGKTIEGGVGGLAFACLGAWFSFTWLPGWFECSGIHHQPVSWLVFGVIVGGAGIVGDLVESMFKRDMGRKDSSTWLPGFGGVLDLLDSILFAAPVAHLCWWWIMF